MELFDHLLLGFQTAVLPVNLLYCGIGVLLGTMIGVLPGIGPAATISILLPSTIVLSPVSSLIMLAGIFYGSQYGSSTTAILINLPGEPSSAVTAIDGYQMARNGRAGAALAIAAIGSFIAGCFSTLVIAIMAIPLTRVAVEFGPPEYFSLIILGLISSTALARGSVLRAIAMIIMGLLLGLVGTDVYAGTQRYTFGVLALYDGLNFVAVAVGIFGVTEILRNLEDESGRVALVTKITSLMPSRAEFRASAGPIARGTLLGSILGVLPSGGALLSSFASYALEKKISRTPERFGQGAIEGVAGPESANNAGTQTSFVPMLTLGLPSNAVMALMIGVMTIKGIVPGPNVISSNPDLFWGLIVSMWVGNVMLVILNLPLVGIWVRLLTVPYYYLFPSIMVFSAIGVYSVNGSLVDLITMVAFGLIGYVVHKLDCEPTPFLLGFILGPMLEEHFRRSMMLARGDPFIFLNRPLSLVLLLVAVVALVVVSMPSISRKRGEVFAEED